MGKIIDYRVEDYLSRIKGKWTEQEMGEYPHWREAKLWELDDTNVRTITGYSYEGLRKFATTLFNPCVQVDQDGDIKTDQGAPYWNTVLNADSHSVWDWRQETDNMMLTSEYFNVLNGRNNSPAT